jgi:ribosomal-protein-alanine N-acetyltransferase
LKTHIRRMEDKDLGEVAALEGQIYEFSWSRGNFEDSLKGGDDCWVLLSCDETSKDQIVGHAVLTVAIDDATILNIAIHSEYRRQGLGKELLDFLLARARHLEAHHCFLEVRPTNAAAISLYENAGFTEVGRRRDYYRASVGREDALVLELKL